MTAYEIITIFIGILALMLSSASLIVALLAFLDRDRRRPLVAVQRERVAVRRLVELGQRHRGHPQHLLHDRLVGHLQVQEARRHALAGYDT